MRHNWQIAKAGPCRSRVAPLPGVLEGWHLLPTSSGAIGDQSPFHLPRARMSHSCYKIHTSCGSLLVLPSEHTLAHDISKRNHSCWDLGSLNLCPQHWKNREEPCFSEKNPKALRGLTRCRAEGRFLLAQPLGHAGDIFPFKSQKTAACSS